MIGGTYLNPSLSFSSIWASVIFCGLVGTVVGILVLIINNLLGLNNGRLWEAIHMLPRWGWGHFLIDTCPPSEAKNNRGPVVYKSEVYCNFPVDSRWWVQILVLVEMGSNLVNQNERGEEATIHIWVTKRFDEQGIYVDAVVRLLSRQSRLLSVEFVSSTWNPDNNCFLF